MATAVSTVDSPASALKALIDEVSPSPRRISDFLDGLSNEERVLAARSLGRSHQRRLWTLVDRFADLDLDYFVPRGTPALTPVRHYGRNSLPAFQLFEKRFYRTADGTIAGANFQSISPFTGPGYYVARFVADRHEVAVDYNLVPNEKPDGWPEIRRNEAGVSRFIYGFMIDTMRRVSSHVSIGSAARHGKDMGSWFMLCREDSR
jgi:hypothetical protein